MKLTSHRHPASRVPPSLPQTQQHELLSSCLALWFVSPGGRPVVYQSRLKSSVFATWWLQRTCESNNICEKQYSWERDQQAKWPSKSQIHHGMVMGRGWFPKLVWPKHYMISQQVKARPIMIKGQNVGVARARCGNGNTCHTAFSTHGNGMVRS